MLILGISGLYHDAAACVLRDGRLVAAIHEERCTRRKHDARFPTRAIAGCLAAAGARPGDVDLVAFHEKPLRKLERVLETTLELAPAGRARFAESIPRWISERLRIRDTLRGLGVAAPIVFPSHHESHAASAFFGSPFPRAAILVNDGVGEWATSTIAVGDGTRVELLREIRFPHSLGLLYSAFTRYLGFEVNDGEYKVMGLAPYGRPRYVDRVRELVLPTEDGAYRLRLGAFDFLAGDDMINARFGSAFGREPREPESEIEPFHADVAASIQVVLEEIVMAQARHAHARTGADALCLAGGVALNAVANGHVRAKGPFRRVWVQPASSDAGAALGAAWIAWHHHLGRERADPMTTAALGHACSDEEIQAALLAHGIAGAMPLPKAELADRVAAMLAGGAVVAVVDGRAEFGPRALGRRSILADPRSAETKARVNASVKFREPFRPFAPAVLEERAAEHFALEGDARFMTFVVPVIGDGLPAITHVDHTARPQTVPATDDGLLRAILEAFERRTGCPALLNTSFNVRGQPIVDTAEDALDTLARTGIDALAIGPYLVERPTTTPEAPVAPPPEPEAPSRAALVATSGLATLLCVALAARGHAYVAGILASGLLALSLASAVRPELGRRLARALDRSGRRLAALEARVVTNALFVLVVIPLALLRGRRWSSNEDQPASWRTVEREPDDSYRRMS